MLGNDPQETGSTPQDEQQPERIPSHLPDDLAALSFPLREVRQCFQDFVMIKRAEELPMEYDSMAGKVKRLGGMVQNLIQRLGENGPAKVPKMKLHVEQVNVADDGSFFMLVDIIDSQFRAVVPVFQFSLGEKSLATFEKLESPTRFLINFSPTNIMTLADPRYLVTPMVSEEGLNEMLGNLKTVAQELNNTSRGAVTQATDVSTQSFLFRKIADEIKYQLEVRDTARAPDKKL